MLNSKIIEAINERVDYANPSDADMLELGSAGKLVMGQLGFGTNRLKNLAEYSAMRYTGNFEFMVAMRDVMAERGRLTEKQAIGVLNCLIAQARRNTKNS